MTKDQTQVNLALYVGETYCEIEVRSSDDEVIVQKLFFLPQTTLKSALSSLRKILSEKNCIVRNTYIVCRYLERLKNFRLGGSVVQVIHHGLENNYTLENSTKQSLAASALIIPVHPHFSVDTLDNEIERIKKINPDANKVVISLDDKLISPENIQNIISYFSDKQFKTFINKFPQNLSEIRKVLLNAGSQGTKDEITDEIKENFPDCHIFFWVKDNYTEQPENYDLYFSADDFLASTQFDQFISKNIHLDIENWVILENSMEDLWDSPWGKIHRPHYKTVRYSLGPLTEILVDSNALLQFSKNPAPSEPGPMTAGRGVKSLILDLFYNDMQKDKSLSELFPQLHNLQVENKINSQFKVLEHAQSMNNSISVKPLKQADVKNFILEIIQFDSERVGCHDKNTTYTGNMSFIIPSRGHQNFSWTNLIFKKSKQLSQREQHI